MVRASLRRELDALWEEAYPWVLTLDWFGLRRLFDPDFPEEEVSILFPSCLLFFFSIYLFSGCFICYRRRTGANLISSGCKKNLTCNGFFFLLKYIYFFLLLCSPNYFLCSFLLKFLLFNKMFYSIYVNCQRSSSLLNCYVDV